MILTHGLKSLIGSLNLKKLEELKKNIESWFKGRDWKATPARQLKFFTHNKKIIKGEVISWKYLPDMKCIVIRRQYGVQYFRHMHDLKTLPQWDIRGLIKKKLIDADKNGFVQYYVDQMVYEANTKWKNFKP